MDTLTHGLSGALLASAAGRGITLTQRERGVAGFLAAAFPDIDYVVHWADPLVYLNLHQGWTHSLVLMPLWAALLAWPSARVTRSERSWREFYPVCLLGIGIHIGGDLITAYGTQVLAPIAMQRYAWPVTFVIDPYFTAIIVLGLGLSVRWRSRKAALAALAMLLGYVCTQGLLRAQALAIAEGYARHAGLRDAEVMALPQPFSPFNWKLILAQGNVYHETHLALFRPAPAWSPGGWWFPTTRAAYRSAGALSWRIIHRYGQDAETARLARSVWSQPGFAGFRAFAVLPALYRVDRGKRRTCVWFSDLRFDLPAMLPAFRYGMCKAQDDAPWRLYRLRLFTENHRQRL
ncbi:MAG: metal-dependent hydrolase [Gammaproteobacteria bacterium]